MSASLVTFALGAREYATPLSSIREVVRLENLDDLPGMTPPLAGVLDLRGTALPVLDLRSGAVGDRGDVMVMESGDTFIGVAVDKVRSVVDEGELSAAGGSADELPSYVVEVLRGTAGSVFLVDLAAMVASARVSAVQA